ncbi:MAG: DUF1565 domain-containing protein, partial [Polyangiaceae bacterium]
SSFKHNAFRDSTTGIAIVDLGTNSPPGTRINLSIQHNVFERLTSYGIHAAGAALYADDISDNRFIGITKQANQLGAKAVGLAMDMFRVGKVRRNEFIGNDYGVEITFPLYSSTITDSVADFGVAGDLGNNVFRCNSERDGRAGDVLIVGQAGQPNETWGGAFHLAGNAWDHLPPTFLTTDPPPNGVDISLRFAPNIVVDRASSSLSSAICPSGKVPGQ